MHKIEDLVSSLLLRHSCVIIPNFGGFVAKSIAAKLDLERGLFLPPSKQLLFNKNLLNNDGLLISEYANSNGLEYPKSQSEIENFVLDIKTKLNSKQAVHLERVGTLSYDLEGNLVFEQDRYFNLLLSSYGLSQVQFIANKEAEIKEPSTEVKKKKEKATIRKINYLKYAAAACLLPLAFYSFWIPTHSGVLESGLISYKDFNPFYKKELGAYSQQKIAIQENTLEEKNIFEVQILTSRNHRIGLYKFDEETNIPIRIEAKKIVKEILDVKIENKTSYTNSFEYIIGCFSNKNNALTLISKLKQEGFAAQLAGGSPLVRVSIGSADSDLQMQTIIHKANEKGYKGWILKK